mmetsp:Transcript_41974/g.104066  ORF Transcript_41974/g.104066 Transcript_41974/m.104066 type:complete len:287 (+) Transcript_41974:965-1825(+)
MKSRRHVRRASPRHAPRAPADGLKASARSRRPLEEATWRRALASRTTHPQPLPERCVGTGLPGRRSREWWPESATTTPRSPAGRRQRVAGLAAGDGGAGQRRQGAPGPRAALGSATAGPAALRRQSCPPRHHARRKGSSPWRKVPWARRSTLTTAREAARSTGRETLRLDLRGWRADTLAWLSQPGYALKKSCCCRALTGRASGPRSARRGLQKVREREVPSCLPRRQMRPQKQRVRRTGCECPTGSRAGTAARFRAGCPRRQRAAPRRRPSASNPSRSDTASDTA